MQIVRINKIQIELKGGLPFVPPFNYRPDAPTINLILDTISETIYGTELYLSVYNKAAALAWKINQGQAFNDANKRTGTLAGLALLNLNHKPVRASDSELVDIAVEVGTGRCTIEELGVWLFKHAV
jgi:death-on-curing family protein